MPGLTAHPPTSSDTFAIFTSHCIRALMLPRRCSPLPPLIMTTFYPMILLIPSATSPAITQTPKRLPTLYNLLSAVLVPFFFLQPGFMCRYLVQDPPLCAHDN